MTTTDPIIPQILIVDDARDIREPLGLYLRQNGFRTLLAEDAATARRLMATSVVHLVLLDIMMPGEDGLGLYAAHLRARKVPVIFLTALDGEPDLIQGLDLGADDYVTKPFSPRELLSRIRAVLRRSPPAQPAPEVMRRRFAGMIHDAALQRIDLEDGRQVALTTGENRLLSALLDNPGEVLSRSRLTDLVRGREAKAFERTVDNIVRRLRAKIGEDARAATVIATEWGGGYRIAVPVEMLVATEAGDSDSHPGQGNPVRVAP